MADESINRWPADALIRSRRCPITACASPKRPGPARPGPARPDLESLSGVVGLMQGRQRR